MLNLKEETKKAFLDAGTKKSLTITFKDAVVALDCTKSDYIIGNDKIVADSLKIKQSIQSGSKIDFMGCVSSTASFTMAACQHKLKDTKVTVVLNVEGASETIPLFVGYVDEATKDSSNSLTQKVECHDQMKQLLDDKDVTEWYDGLGDFYMSLKDFRDSLFTHLGITQVERELPRDDMFVKKTLDTSIKEDENDEEVVRNTQVSAASVIQCICQLNAAFGIINNEGKMDYKVISPDMVQNAYSNSMISRVKYSDSEIKNITAVVLYDGTSEEYEENGTALAYYPEDKSLVDGDDAVPYEINDNFLLYAYEVGDAVDIAKSIYESIKAVKFTPCEIEAVGIPWMECGDRISFSSTVSDTLLPENVLYPDNNLYPYGYEEVETIIMSRTLSGNKLFKDTIEAKGEPANSSITTLNEVISAERFYRKIGQDKLFSSIEQTKNEINMLVYDEDQGVYSQIKQQANRIDLVVERQSHDYSAITTRIEMTENSLNLHGSQIEMISDDMNIVAREMITFRGEMATFSDMVVNFDNTKVNITDLATGGKTIINGSNITTGTISCNRIGLSKITIKGQTYDVDWNEILVPRCYANRAVTFTDMSKVLYASCWKDISIPILEEEKIGELTSIKIKGYNTYKILDKDSLSSRPICGPTTEYGIGTDEPNGWLMPKIIENNCDVYPTLTADIEHGKIY